MKAGKNSFLSKITNLLPLLFDFFLSLTGACLILFIVAHLLMDASILISQSLFNHISICLEKSNMAFLGVYLVITGLVVHGICASVKQLPSFNKRIQYIIYTKCTFETLIYYVQIISGILLMLLAAIHVMEIMISGIDMINSVTSAQRFFNVFNRIFYSLFMSITVLHTGVGMYRIYVKWFGRNRHVAAVVSLLLFCSYFVLSAASIYTYSAASADAYELEKLLREKIKDVEKIEDILGRNRLRLNEDLLRRIKIEDTSILYELEQ